MENLIGRTVDRYQIVEQIGIGGMAVVYKAHDARLDRPVAIKIIRKGRIPEDDLVQLLERFDREARALAHLSHPNIVKVHDYGKFDGVPYFVMEYLAGGTLKGRMTRRIPWAESAKMLAPIACALQYAHQQGIIHRDVKPANVLLTETGVALLSDFGIAKLLENVGGTSLTDTGSGIGTPEYMAPEQWVGQAVPQTDVYALGIVLYQMITGRLPHEADTPAGMLLKHVNEPVPPPKTLVPDLPDPVEAVLLKALAKRVDGRYANMEEFATVLERLAGGEAALYQRRATPILDRLFDKLASEPKADTAGARDAALAAPELGASGADETRLSPTSVSEAVPLDADATRLIEPAQLASTVLISQPAAAAETVLRQPLPEPRHQGPRPPWWAWALGVIGLAILVVLMIGVALIVQGLSH
jgi:eukaryotic-like serine/threonine-protein kinase